MKHSRMKNVYDLFKVLKNVIDDHLLRLIGMDSSVGVHVNDCILKPNEWEPKGSLQGLCRIKLDYTADNHIIA